MRVGQAAVLPMRALMRARMRVRMPSLACMHACINTLPLNMTGATVCAPCVPTGPQACGRTHAAVPPKKRTMPFGPSVVFTSSAIATAPTKAACVFGCARAHE